MSEVDRVPRPLDPYRDQLGASPDHRRVSALRGGAQPRSASQLLEPLVGNPSDARHLEDLGALSAIPLATRHFEDLAGYFAEPIVGRLGIAQRRAGELLAGRTVWMVNSTAFGGGVAQLLRTLLPYWRGARIDVRWIVVRGSGEFFRVTKRFHNQLQGQPGDGDVLGVEELAILDRAAESHSRALASVLAPGDVVVLNDPQTAGMAAALERAGTIVIWSCHVGIDNGNEFSEHAWRCLRPRVAGVRRFVFSRYTSLPEWLGGAETSILTPGIDPGSTKNLPMSDRVARTILQHLGLAAGVPATAPSYECTDGSTATLAARPTVLDSDGAPDWSRQPVVVSLARWDRIKDPLGILEGFLERVLGTTDAHLLLAGPDSDQVADDPDGAAVLAEVRERWRGLAAPARARVHVACLPLTSPDENDAMVNAIQRQATVVVKKSLQEGFGLGVAEAMWKGRPVVASAVGGHLEQVQHLHNGLLVKDPADVGAFGDAIVKLLRDPLLAARLGEAGRERTRALFLNDRHFTRWLEVLGSALERPASPAGSPRSTPHLPTRAWVNAETVDLGDHDPLTGLWNRRRFEQELDLSRQHAEHLALLSIDVDAFNNVINRHGADAAEGVIRIISHVLADGLSPNQSLARMGGDEFVAILFDANPRRVESLADRLCAAVRHQPLPVGSIRVHATISIGCAILDLGKLTHHEALLAAETALHEAKVAGGDRAVLHHFSPGGLRTGNKNVS